MYQRLFVLCLFPALLLSACKPQAQSLVPVTGDRIASSAPARVELVRTNVLKYVVSSARLTALPQDANWQMEASPLSDQEYQYRNGDWLITIWLAETDDGIQRVVIFNKANDTAWTGYVTSNGEVVDTYYAR